MAWQKGKSKSKTGGRKRGTPNKRTTDFLKILEEMEFCPTRSVIESHRRAMKEFDRMDEVVDKLLDAAYDIKDLGEQERASLIKKVYSYASSAPQYLAIAQRAAAELLQYAQPKRKAIEFKPPGDGDEKAGGVLIFMPSNGREAKKAS